MKPGATRTLRRVAWREGMPIEGMRTIPEEMPVAITYNRTTFAIMLATPADLEDFAVGFSLTEGIVRRADEIEDMELVWVRQAVELRMWLGPEAIVEAERRRRRLAGPSGCGLCGIESLEDALRAPREVVASTRFAAEEIIAAMATLPAAQQLNQATHAMHAAAFWSRAAGLVAVREDVGRHNALDKLAGVLARRGISAAEGLVLLSSRLSLELVQKAAAIGAPVLVAVSAPTALAVRTAESAGITLIGVARADGFELFTHAERVAIEPVPHVA
jgi:FdhD protein